MKDKENLKCAECEEDRKRYDESVKKFKEVLEQAAIYTQIILSVGYISFFTLLSWIKDSISFNMRVHIAFGFLFSITFFLIWETLKMLNINYNKVRYDKKEDIINLPNEMWILFFIIIAIPMGYSIVLLLCQLYEYILN